eukprot:g21112.t1
MDLVLFEDAMKHVARICRIISSPSGHPLLVGVGGSGRQSLSRLSAFVCQHMTYMIVITSSYSLPDLKTDLQYMNLWAFYISRVRKNLHMSLCFSPVGDGLWSRARRFPALVNCTTIDWFQPWPEDALLNVAHKFLMKLEALGPPDDPHRQAIIDFFPYSFDAVNEISHSFIRDEKRFAYTTPKSVKMKQSNDIIMFACNCAAV